MPQILAPDRPFLPLCLGSFYSRAFEKMFQQCLELPSQSRYSISFPLLCTHFMSCTHELCPEEVRGWHWGAGHGDHMASLTNGRTHSMRMSSRNHCEITKDLCV